MERITIKQASEMLSVSEQAVRELVKRGHFGKCVGKGRRTYLIYREQVEKWLEQ